MTAKKQKILYLITKSNFGGAQKYVLELATAAKEAGHEVTVACGGAGEAGAPAGKLVAKLQAADLRVIKVRNFLRDMSFFSDLKAFVEVWLILRKVKPDVLHVTSSKAGGIGALAGRLARTPSIVFTSHGLTVDEVWRPKWQRTLIYISTWLTMKLAHASIMISTETYERAKNMPTLANKVFLIKNGVTNIDFLEKTVARKELAPAVAPRAFWVGGMGELHPNKNWSVAILAMLALPEKIHLLIIGEGEERTKLENLIYQNKLQDRVHLLGFVEGDRYLKAFDVFVLPSQKEGLPYVLLEAGLAGLATIASDLPGNNDIINTGETGFLVNPSPKLISATIEMLYRDEGMRRRLGQALKEVIERDFSIKKMTAQTFTLYESSKSGA